MFTRRHFNGKPGDVSEVKGNPYTAWANKWDGLHTSRLSNPGLSKHLFAGKLPRLVGVGVLHDQGY